MTSEDLKNSNNELKATPEETGAANAPESNPGSDFEKQKKEVQSSEADEEKVQSQSDENIGQPEEQEAPEIDEDEVVSEEPVSKEEAESEIEGKQEGVKKEIEEPKTEVEEEETVESGAENQGEDKAELEAEKKEPAVEVQSEEKVISETEEPVAKVKQEDKAESEEARAGEAEAKNEGKHEDKAPEEPERQSVDYTALNEVELINALRELLEKHADDDIKADIDSIKINFYKKHRAVAEAEKKQFLEDGGNEDDFEPSNAIYEDDLRNLLRDFRQLRNQQHRQMEDEKEENLQRKYEIIDEIKNLVNRKESINKTFQEFRDLQQEWREIGLVPQSRLKDLWENYHHHVENFYDYIKINRELRDLDLKKNLESKLILCEKAEELLVEPSVIKAFNILQKYHEQWREIGPVPRDKKEDLWERFKAATSKINKKHQGYFEGRKQEQKKNLDAKTVLCEKAEEIANAEILNHKDWDKRSRELVELQKVWRTIGFAPKKDNNRIYERFRSACDQFFDAKREFYAENKELQMNNLQMKTDLCVQAEALKDSTDWRKTTEEFIRIQKKWKDIGPVPRKHSDPIWKRFRAACDYFFDNKSKHFHHVDEEQVENLKLKKELIEEVKNYKPSKSEDVNLENIKEFQRRWTDIGHVPFKDKDVVQNEFRDAVNMHFDNLKIDDQKRSLLKFKTKISNISGTTRGNNKMRYERDKYVSKLKQLESDLILLNNNIGFFANTKNAESLIDDVNKKIQDTEEKIEFLKEKISIIDSMDDDD
ncbi:DUF349 domain-containing protein [uncultured Sunxiuqinia sp.]|uniref:DUF349 domain-containing protein n=1 Tax=uncultured Sunxiuqinia sp. TaxID=1573825 RepID=UPI0030DD6A0C|tara:strand:+ start:54972 stop:57272 length:2301 start_codon:yes stop_codon:yes gene_type:complete